MKTNSAHIAGSLSLALALALLVAPDPVGRSVLAQDRGARMGSANAEVPATPLLSEEFEVGELEDPSVAMIGGDWPRYLTREWSQDFGPNQPKFMNSGLALGSGPSNSQKGKRHLRIALRGGDATIVGPQVPLRPHAIVRVRADLVWEGLGEGRISIGVRDDDGNRLRFLEVSGDAQEWQRVEQSIELPANVSPSRVEIWIDGDRTRFDGHVGIDHLQVEELPSILLSWRGSLRRIHPKDDRPINVKSVGFPEGEYRLDFIVEDPEGREIFRERIPRFVTERLPLDFDPRLRWFEHAVSRGLYTVRMVLRSEDGGWELRDSREFALAGAPPFPFVLGRGRWGLHLSSPEAPPWLSIFQRERLLFDLPRPEGAESLEPASLPDWLIERGEFRRSLLLDDRQGWSAADVTRLAALTSRTHEWYWAGDLTEGAAVAAGLLATAPYLRFGLRAEGGQGAPGGSGAVPAGSPFYRLSAAELASPRKLVELDLGQREWTAELDPALFPDARPEHTLAMALFLLATRRPRTVFLSEPGPLLFNRPGEGGWVPLRAFLAWEFVTGFLSGATFVQLEEWDPQGVCAVFERDGEEFLFVVGTGPDHLLTLRAGGGRAFDSVGRERPVTVREGKAEILVSSEPILVAGLDLDRVRTLQSFRVTAGPIEPLAAGSPGPEGASQAIRVQFDNHFGGAVEAQLELDPPEGWDPILPSSPIRVAESKEGAWNLPVKVPAWFGIEDQTDFVGRVKFRHLADGRTETFDLALPIPFQSPYIAIEPANLGSDSAEVRVRNVSLRTLDIVVYLGVKGSELDRKYGAQRLGPGEERRYSIQYSPAAETRRLFAGVVINTVKSHVNRNFEIPKQ